MYASEHTLALGKDTKEKTECFESFIFLKHAGKIFICHFWHGKYRICNIRNMRRNLIPCPKESID